MSIVNGTNKFSFPGHFRPKAAESSHFEIYRPVPDSEELQASKGSRGTLYQQTYTHPYTHRKHLFAMCCYRYFPPV